MAKAGLSKQDFIEVALAMIAESGVDRLSMRKVAARLGVSAMAMYKHFANKEALLSAALDGFIAQAEVIPQPDLPWQDWLKALAEAMFQALCRDRSWVPYLAGIELGEQANQVTQACIEKLMTAGFSRERALQAYLAMLQLLIGAVCLQTLFTPADQQGAEPEAETASGPFSTSLDMLIAGLAQQQATAPSR